MQSGFPDHPILAVLKNGKYEDFATMVLKEREENKLPPFSFQAILRCHSRSIKKNIDALNKLASINLTGIELFGPIPASLPKKGGNYFHQIILQASSRKNLSQNLELILKRIQADKRSVKWALDIDPVEY